MKVGLEKGLETSATALQLAKAEFVFGAKGTVAATATVTSDVAATGAVEFLVDGTLVATAPLAAGVAKANLALPGALAAGAHEVTARYTGSADVAGSTSAPVVITVRAAASDTDLISVLPVHVNSVLPATLLAWVTLETGKAPVGVVEFREGTTVVANGSRHARLRELHAAEQPHARHPHATRPRSCRPSPPTCSARPAG